MADKTTTLYRLPDGEPVELDSQHAKNLLAYEKQLQVANYSAKPITPPATPDDETKRPAGNPDGNESREHQRPKTGSAG